ncbi:MAG: hypothetical protein V4642_09090 [Bacteroidota bacterium]
MSLRAKRGNRKYCLSRHSVFAIATSEDLLAMTDDFKVFKKKL